MKRLICYGLAIVAVAGMVAVMMVYQDEKVSRHEDEWRNLTNSRFQQDFGK